MRWVIMVLLLASCAPNAIEEATPTHALRNPVDESPSGAYKHRGSGLSLPSSIGILARIQVRRFDSEGYEIGGTYTYQQGRCAIRASIFVYPAPYYGSSVAPAEQVRAVRERNLASEFAALKLSIVTLAPGAQLVSEGISAQVGPQLPLPALGASFRSDAVADDLQLMFYRDAWYITHRVTTQGECDSSAQESIRRFLLLVTWSGAA